MFPQGLHSQHSIFFVKYESVQWTRVFVTGNPFFPCLVYALAYWANRKLQRKWSVVNTLVLALKFCNSTFPLNFLGHLSFHYLETLILGQHLQFNSLHFFHLLIKYFNQANLSCINTFACLKINQYWTWLFVSYSVKTQFYENTVPELFCWWNATLPLSFPALTCGQCYKTFFKCHHWCSGRE